MKPIPAPLRKQLAEETFRCAREREGTCSGRMTVEHAFGRRDQKRWKLVILCWFHHLGAGLDKELNRHLAYRQVNEKELKRAYPKTFDQHIQAKKYLAEKYAKYAP